MGAACCGVIDNEQVFGHLRFVVLSVLGILMPLAPTITNLRLGAAHVSRLSHWLQRQSACALSQSQALGQLKRGQVDGRACGS